MALVRDMQIELEQLHWGIGHRVELRDQTEEAGLDALQPVLHDPRRAHHPNTLAGGVDARWMTRRQAVEQRPEAHQLVQRVEPVFRVPKDLADITQVIRRDELTERNAHGYAWTLRSQRVPQSEVPRVRYEAIAVAQLREREPRLAAQSLRLNALAQPEHQLCHGHRGQHLAVVVGGDRGRRRGFVGRKHAAAAPASDTMSCRCTGGGPPRGSQALGLSRLSAAATAHAGPIDYGRGRAAVRWSLVRAIGAARGPQACLRLARANAPMPTAALLHTESSILRLRVKQGLPPASPCRTVASHAARFRAKCWLWTSNRYRPLRRGNGRTTPPRCCSAAWQTGPRAPTTGCWLCGSRA